MPTKTWKSGLEMLRRIRRILALVLLLGLVVLIWARAWYVMKAAKEMKTPGGGAVSLADQAAILFGASTIALVVVTLVLGVVAVFGWQTIKDSVRRDIEEGTRKRFDSLATELRGRELSVLGHIHGTLSSEPDRLEATNLDRLSEALWNCEKGYTLLKKIEGKVALMALNNLVYYSCIQGDRSKSRDLLRKARELKDAGDEYHDANLLLTFCRAVLQFGTDPKEIEEARSVASEVLTRKDLTDLQQKEARFYLASLSHAGTPSSPTG
jgi:hypothetical protein